MGIGVGIGVGGGSSGGGGAPSAKTATVSATATGVVYTIARLLGSSSTLSLITGTNANLSLSGSSISAAAALGTGVSQVAEVREALGQIAIEYPVTITGAATVAAAPLLIASPGNGQITFTLADGAANGSAITSRTLYVGSASGAETSVGPVTFPYTLTGLTNGTPIYAQATTTNGIGESNRSAEISATPTANSAILREDGSYLLAEDMSRILREVQ